MVCASVILPVLGSCAPKGQGNKTSAFRRVRADCTIADGCYQSLAVRSSTWLIEWGRLAPPKETVLASVRILAARRSQQPRVEHYTVAFRRFWRIRNFFVRRRITTLSTKVCTVTRMILFCLVNQAFGIKQRFAPDLHAYRIRVGS